jgi:hypothetical protein
MAISITRIHKAQCTLTQKGYGIWWYEPRCGKPKWKASMIYIDAIHVSQPHFWKSVKMTFTLPKWRLGSPPRLPKLHSSIAGVKTPRLEALFISLESYQSVDVENGLA